MDISQDEQRQLIAAGARMQEAEEALFDFRKTRDSHRMARDLKTRIMGADNRCRLIVETNPNFDQQALEDFKHRESELEAVYERAAKAYETIEGELSAKGVDVEKVLDELGC